MHLKERHSLTRNSRCRFQLVIRHLANDRIAAHNAVLAYDRRHGIDHSNDRTVSADQTVHNAIAAFVLGKALSEIIKQCRIVGMHQRCIHLTGKLGQLGLLVAQHLAEIFTGEFQVHWIAQAASVVSTQMVHDVMLAVGDGQAFISFLRHRIAAPFPR